MTASPAEAPSPPRWWEGRGARRVAVLLPVAVAALLAAAFTVERGIPHPAVHDEHSYLLAAETFRLGRLSNPPHEHWPHFQSFHVLQEPTYASKYPPGQGLLLALGDLLGHPIVGAWLGVAALAGATAWMLLGFFGPRWSLFGGLLAAIHYGLPNYWAQSYWGGSVTAVGGALVLGAAGRLAAAPKAGSALVLGAGLVLLAISRPLEGLVFATGCSVALLVAARRLPSERRRRLARRLAVGTGAVLALGLGWLAIYHQAVTGDPLKFPHRVYSETYSSVPQFLWMEPGPLPDHEIPVHYRYWREVDARFELLQSPVEWRLESLRRLRMTWRFYGGWALLLPMLLAIAGRHRLWSATVVALLAAYAILFWGYQSFHPHYLAAMAGPLLFLVVAGCEGLERRVGVSQRTLLAAMILFLGLHATDRRLGEAPYLRHPVERPAERVRRDLEDVLARFEGPDLILVRVGIAAPTYDEWVANSPEIDRQEVVWAHDLGPRNRALRRYYPCRTVWGLVVGEDPREARLVLIREPVEEECAVLPSSESPTPEPPP